MKKLIRESLNETFYEDEAFVFQQNMAKLEAELEEFNPQAWEKFEESSGELWRELRAENWEEAFKQDPMACYAFKQELESTVNVFK